jgi:magnesium-transporting ATPase (P-type)/mannitol/fructose-specific phosphotransferase system IIA component (Ntr-type)
MRLSDLLDEQTIRINLRARDKKGALEEMAGILAKSGKITDSRLVLKALLDREAAGSTAVGKGIAFPHARIDGMKEPVAVLAVSQDGVQFDGGEERTVYLFFLFLTPSENSELHLQILSKSAAIFSDTGFYHAIRKARTSHGLLGLLLHHEKGGKEAFFPLPAGDIFRELGTDAQGLTDREAANRLKRYGPNILKEVRRKSLLLRFFENLTNLFAILLWVGGILAFLVDMQEMGAAIFVVIVVNAVFSFWQEFKAERALEALKKLIPQKARVVRGGVQREVPAEELVPGDIIIVEEGDAVSADARLIEASALRVDNSALTGESKPIHKTAEAITDSREFLWTELPNLVFAGTAVSSGHGKAAVIATGMHTEIGRIASLTQELQDEKSPLQREIETITRVITVIAVTMGVLFFFAGTFFGKLSLAAAFLFTIGIIVANVPEGLLPTVTLALAMAVQRMARRNVLIKRLSSVETLGSTTVICTDKTGTLTTGEIAVTKIWSNGRLITVGGNPHEPTGTFTYQGAALSHEEMERTGLYRLFDAALLCNNAGLHPPGKRGESWSIIGDPTEGALLVMAAKGGFDIAARSKALPRIGHLPFEAVRKRMTSVNLVDGKPIAHVKGAPAEMLDLCGQIFREGRIEPLTGDERAVILSENDAMATEGLRVLAVAVRQLGFSEGFTIENTEQDLVFLGLVGMMDPPRPEVPAAIELCGRAGIRVVMITGDYGLTAVAIGRKVGLARTDNPHVITGRELSEMDDGALKGLLRDEVIFARTTPEHKMRIVSALQDLGEVVAVTGDGVNDAPALKKADIGVAMGIRGSDVAKEAAAMLLTDDNFASIVAAIEEGRAVYANIKKFVTYIFSSNIPELVPFVAFVLFRIPLPLTVMQILAVDLGTDLVPALGLGTEPPEPGTMDRPPRPRKKRLLESALLLRAYCFLGPIEAFASMAGFFFVYWQAGWRPGMEMTGSGTLYATATTMCFTGIVAAQVGNVLACRTERESVFRIGLFTNKLVLAGILSELVITLLLMYVPVLRDIFGFAPLGTSEWIFLAAFAPALLILEETRKKVIRRYLHTG